MSEASKGMVNSLIRNAVGLGLFALVTVGVISLTKILTHDRIRAAEDAVIKERLLEITGADRFGDFFSLTLPVPGKQTDGRPPVTDPVKLYLIRQADETTAVIVPGVTVKGYNGTIRLLSGIDSNNVLLGVRVVEHQETPGLGDGIEAVKSKWIQQFNGKSLTNTQPEDWATVQDGGVFDALTRATITTRAVVESVHLTLLWHSEHADIIAQAAQRATDTMTSEADL